MAAPIHERMSAATNRDNAIALAERLCDALDSEPFYRISHGAIDNVVADLRTLRSLVGQCTDIDLAIGYLEQMKRPRADKHALGQRAKYAAGGAKAMARNMTA